ncbi:MULTISPECIES: hypothetical protein [unclassified Frankia]|uniref:hypothetical protein n=1 Tax=unclassified Frankia TaxID=2632575 RepID=UPI0020254DBA
MTGTLDDAYADHLRLWAAGSASPRLVDALVHGGEPAEAELLRAYLTTGDHWMDRPRTSGVWHDRACWIGARPPATARGGDLWFDVVEVALMVLIPRPETELAAFSAEEWQALTACVGWLSTRPVRRWQFLGFASVTGLDPGRTIGSSAYAMGARGAWADRYAGYFGKSLPGWDSWWGASCALGDEIINTMWPADIPEIGFRVAEDAMALLGRARALLTDQDPDGPFPLGERFAVTDRYWLPGMRFRTELSAQLGLLPADRGENGNMPVLARP